MPTQESVKFGRTNFQHDKNIFCGRKLWMASMLFSSYTKHKYLNINKYIYVTKIEPRIILMT